MLGSLIFTAFVNKIPSIVSNPVLMMQKSFKLSEIEKTIVRPTVLTECLLTLLQHKAWPRQFEIQTANDFGHFLVVRNQWLPQTGMPTGRRGGRGQLGQFALGPILLGPRVGALLHCQEIEIL